VHSRLPYEVNKAIVDLAAQSKDYVCAVDVAGVIAIRERLDEFVELYAYARSLGINYRSSLRNPFWVLPGIVALSDADWSRHPDSATTSRVIERGLDEISV